MAKYCLWHALATHLFPVRGQAFSAKCPYQGLEWENSAMTPGLPQRARSLLISALVSALAFLSGCGGGSSSSPNPEPPSGPSVISVAVSPTAASVQTGQTQNFTAMVANDSQNKG